MNEVASRALFESEVEQFTDKLFEVRGWKLHSKTYPVLDISFRREGRTDMRIRMVCDNWNDSPPSIQLLSIEGQRLTKISKDPAGIFNDSAHPITGFPFICSIGSREYHTHTSHTGDYWDNYKNKSGFDLGGILTKVWRAWLKAQ